MKPLVSVIIPAYNAEKYIAGCLDSIISQEAAELNIIVVDDGSTDSTGDICDSYASKYNFIKVIHTDNGGPARARNEGIKYVTGDYLMFMDADDKICAGSLSELIRLMDNDKTDMAVCRFEDCEKWKSGIFTGQFVLGKIIHENVMYGGGYLWCRLIRLKPIMDAMGKLPDFQEGLTVYEDKIWVMEILKNIKSVSVSDKMLYQYNNNEDSLTHRDPDRLGSRIKAWRIIFDLVMGEIPGGEDISLSHKKCKRECIHLIYSMYKKRDRQEAISLYKEYSQMKIREWAGLKTEVKNMCLKMARSK